MKYSQEIAFKILKAMEEYPDSRVPSPYEPLEEDTGRPKPKPPTEQVAIEGLTTHLPNPQPPTYRKLTPPDTTDPKSWVGEMPNKTFLAHTSWLKQEKLITTRGGSFDLPTEITMAGVQLLKAVEAIGGWERAMEIASEKKAPATLTSLHEALRKAKPKK